MHSSARAVAKSAHAPAASVSAPSNAYRTQAFDRFKHYVPTTVYGLNLSAPGMTSDDFMQEAYVILVQAIDAHARLKDPKYDLETWCKSHLRSRLIDKQREYDAKKRSLGSASIDDPSVVGFAVEQFQERDLDLARALSDLPSTDRRVIEMHYSDQMTDREIATVVGLTPHQVLSRRLKALSRVRHAYLGQDTAEPQLALFANA